ncbi:MAG TPA: hypothetical protein VI997_06150 [Candidatus Thermoplasmatota archaeon]|nr:hypothetical protein [Candidatus Thermoplasmatota archaeon]
MAEPPAAFDRLLALASLSLVGGLYLDGWAHAHRPGLESFFTPWHAVLYSGFGACAAVLAWAAWRARGVPDGRGASYAGAAVFVVGGVGDLLWHVAFGVEVSVEALVSPTHLLLATGMVLIVSSPLAAALHRRAPRESWTSIAPALLCAALVLGLLTFFTQLAHPGARPWPHVGNRPPSGLVMLAPGWPVLPSIADGLLAEDVAKSYGLAAVLLQTLLLLAIVLPLARRVDVPPGGFTLVLGLDGLLVALMRDHMGWAVAMLAAGVAADAFFRKVRPAGSRARLAVFATLVPVGLWTFWLVALAAAGGVWWSVHMWAGTVAASGLLGWGAAVVFSSASSDEPARDPSPSALDKPR